MRPRVYLAGPDVFFPEPEKWAARKQEICARHGLTGVSPLDEYPNEPPEWAALPLWRKLSARNEAHIRSCQALIANLTPFRGPSADVGTVFEVGFARALGLPLFGYAHASQGFLERTLAFLGAEAKSGPNGSWLDGDGFLVEDFGRFDNLMIEGGIAGAGGTLDQDGTPAWNDLALFERAAVNAAARLRTSPSAG